MIRGCLEAQEINLKSNSELDMGLVVARQDTQLVTITILNQRI